MNLSLLNVLDFTLCGCELGLGVNGCYIIGNRIICDVKVVKVDLGILYI